MASLYLACPFAGAAFHAFVQIEAVKVLAWLVLQLAGRHDPVD